MYGHIHTIADTTSSCCRKFSTCRTVFEWRASIWISDFKQKARALVHTRKYIYTHPHIRKQGQRYSETETLQSVKIKRTDAKFSHSTSTLNREKREREKESTRHNLVQQTIFERQRWTINWVKKNRFNKIKSRATNLQAKRKINLTWYQAQVIQKIAHRPKQYYRSRKYFPYMKEMSSSSFFHIIHHCLRQLALSLVFRRKLHFNWKISARSHFRALVWKCHIHMYNVSISEANENDIYRCSLGWIGRKKSNQTDAPSVNFIFSLTEL